MPSKDIHQASTLLLAGAVYYLMGDQAASPREQILSVSGIITGLYISPDMDLAENFQGEPFWYLYGKLFKHRGVSHWPMIGTLTRLAYMGILLVPFVYIFGYGWWLEAQIRSGLFTVWALGLSLSDFLHYMLDITVTRIKKAL